MCWSPEGSYLTTLEGDGVMKVLMEGGSIYSLVCVRGYSQVHDLIDLWLLTSGRACQCSGCGYTYWKIQDFSLSSSPITGILIFQCDHT